VAQGGVSQRKGAKIPVVRKIKRADGKRELKSGGRKKGKAATRAFEMLAGTRREKRGGKRKSRKANRGGNKNGRRKTRGGAVEARSWGLPQS